MLRDIKQVFKADAPMVMLRSIKWGGEWYHRGDPIPEALKSNPAGKLRIFWSGGFIQRADWDPVARRHVPRAPAEESPEEEPTVTAGKGGWYTVTFPDGTVRKIRGKAALDTLLGES